MGNPRRINPVSVALVVLIAAGVFAGWKFGYVYWQRHQVESKLKGAQFEAARMSVMGENPGEDALLDRLRSEITALGITEEGLEIYFEDDYSRLHVKYQVDVRFPFDVSKRMKFHVKTSIERKDL